MARIGNLVSVYFASQLAIEKFPALSLFIFSKLGDVQSKLSPVLMHNIESTQITQLIVGNVKVRPFLRDAMSNESKFLRKENFNADWSK